LAHLDRLQRHPFKAVRYFQEDNSQWELRLPAPGGLGIRRLALLQALERRAAELGVRRMDGWRRGRNP